MINAGKRIIDLTLPLGYDEKHGGLIAFTDVLGKPPMQLEWDMKLWWPQCEAMIATRLAFLLFGEEKYRIYFEKLEAYVQSTLWTTRMASGTGICTMTTPFPPRSRATSSKALFMSRVCIC